MLRLNFLCANILKSIYFLDRSILDASLGSKPFWVWASLIEMSKILLDGIRWQIGNEKLVNIWMDKWILDLLGFKVPFDPSFSHSISSVDELMMSNGCEWDRDLVKELFWVDAAEAILKIPISMVGFIDKLIWHWFKNGTYSIKSGYRLAFKDIRADIFSRAFDFVCPS